MEAGYARARNLSILNDGYCGARPIGLVEGRHERVDLRVRGHMLRRRVGGREEGQAKDWDVSEEAVCHGWADLWRAEGDLVPAWGGCVSLRCIAPRHAERLRGL